jgi:hypothetical protein
MEHIVNGRVYSNLTPEATEVAGGLRSQCERFKENEGPHAEERPPKSGLPASATQSLGIGKADFQGPRLAEAAPRRQGCLKDEVRFFTPFRIGQ